MFPKPRISVLSSVGAALMPMLLVSGCATQEAVSEQTDPLRRQLDQMQTSLHSTAATAKTASDLAVANQARHEAIAKQLETLLAEFKALQEGQVALKEGASKAELRQDELATLTHDNSEAASQIPELAERLTKSDLRLDELATTVNEATTAAALAQEGLAAAAEGTAALGGRLTQAEMRMDTLSAQVQEALAASKQDYIRQYGKVVSTIGLTEDKTLYPINSPELGAGDRAKLDELAARLKGSQEEYHLDIQGHTDNIGTDDINYALGKARAEVVKRYLHEQGGLPLSRMSVISYGATHPVVTGSYGNRRIVINLLVLEKK